MEECGGVLSIRFRTQMRSRAKTIGIMLGLAAIYFCAGKFGLSLAFVNRSASAVWPPAGIALAALLLFGFRLWPGVFLGAFLVNMTTQGSWATSFGIAAGNTLEACLAAALTDRFARGRKAFERTQDIFRFFAFATLLGAAVSASIGVTTLCLGGFASWSQFGVIWLTWWLGDGVSILVITPLLVILFQGGRRPLRERRVLEGVSSVVVLLATVFFIFWGADSLLHRRAPLEYLAIPPVLWMAFRFGPAGATLSTCFTSAIAVWATLHGFGPFAAPDSNQALVLLQGFMGTITFTMLVMASVIVERQRSEHRLKAQDNISRVLAEARTYRKSVM